LCAFSHVEIADGFMPVPVHLDGQRPHQPQTALGVAEDAHDMVRRFSTWLNRSSIFVDFIGIMQQSHPAERAKRHSAASGVLSV
jgi:hypothetical protein